MILEVLEDPPSFEEDLAADESMFGDVEDKEEDDIKSTDLKLESPTDKDTEEVSAKDISDALGLDSEEDNTESLFDEEDPSPEGERSIDSDLIDNDLEDFLSESPAGETL